MLNATTKRKYKSDSTVNVSSTLSPEVFYEIEALAKEFGVTKSEIVRQLVLRGLAEYRQKAAHICIDTSPAKDDDQANY